MSKFIVLYSTLIIDEVYKEGDTFEFPIGTDRNFIQRLETIWAIKELKEEGSDIDDDQTKDDERKIKKTSKDDKKVPKDDKKTSKGSNKSQKIDENGNIND